MFDFLLNPTGAAGSVRGSPLRRFLSSRIACLGALLAVFATSAFGQNLILDYADKPDPVTSENVDEWIKKAENGDWPLMIEFAAAYLYPDDCKKLDYGHRCRAMVAKPEAGRKLLFQIIDSPKGAKVLPSGISDAERQIRMDDIAWFRAIFAVSRVRELQARMKEAGTRESSQKPDPNDPACKDYIKYHVLAAEDGDACAAWGVARSYRNGYCTEKDSKKSEYFDHLGRVPPSCPPRFEDRPDPVTPKQVDRWLKRAESGDWQLMAKFAKAYLSPDDCDKYYKYGHRCRAMAMRSDAGRKFLFQIINTPINPTELPRDDPGYYLHRVKLGDIKSLQRDFARSRWREASARKTGKWPDPDDPACKDFIKYLSLAAENGDACAAQEVGDAYGDGLCTQKDPTKTIYYNKLGTTCPIP